ncbi:MAG: hypothetical protein V4490_06410 [Pseudomonadota bacterium]
MFKAIQAAKHITETAFSHLSPDSPVNTTTLETIMRATTARQFVSFLEEEIFATMIDTKDYSKQCQVVRSRADKIFVPTECRHIKRDLGGKTDTKSISPAASKSCFFEETFKAYFRMKDLEPGDFTSEFEKQFSIFTLVSIIHLASFLEETTHFRNPTDHQVFIKNLGLIFSNPHFKKLLESNGTELKHLLKQLHELNSPVEEWVTNSRNIDTYLKTYSETITKIENLEKTLVFRFSMSNEDKDKNKKINAQIDELLKTMTKKIGTESILDMVTQKPSTVDRTKTPSAQSTFKGRMFALPLIGSALQGLFGSTKQSFGKQLLNCVILLLASPYVLFAALFVGVSSLVKQSAVIEPTAAPRVAPETSFENAQTSPEALFVSTPAPTPQKTQAEKIAEEQQKQQEIAALKDKILETDGLLVQGNTVMEALTNLYSTVYHSAFSADTQFADPESPAARMVHPLRVDEFRRACDALMSFKSRCNTFSQGEALRLSTPKITNFHSTKEFAPAREVLVAETRAIELQLSVFKQRLAELVPENTPTVLTKQSP